MGPHPGPHRLHWATGVLRWITVVGFYLAHTPLFLFSGDGPPPAARLSIVVLLGIPVAVVGAIAGFWSWVSLRFWVDGDDLVVERGVIRRQTRRIGLSRMQAVDVVRPLVTRVFGLAEIRLELAGGDRAEIAFRFLSRRHGEALRAELLARAAGLPGHTPEAPEQPLWMVPFLTLLASLVAKLPVLGAVLLLGGLIALGVAKTEAGVLGAVLPIILGLVRGVVAPLVGYGRFRIATSPDGLRLHSGLVQTRMQTVPPGRVQAVRIVEPLLWRALGWARVDVTVAGYAGTGQALSSILLPVAPRQMALQVAGLAFPGTDIAAIRLLPPPRRVGPRSLFGGPAAGTDEVVFVARQGAVCRTLSIVAHARAQGVRMRSGPWQRLWGLASVTVDAPPGPVRVIAVDRDLVEARAIVESEAERARRARAGRSGP